MSDDTTGHDATDMSRDSTTEPLDVAAVAARLGISEGAVRKRIERGRLLAHKDTSGQWLIWPADLEAFTSARQSATRQDTTETGHDTTEDAPVASTAPGALVAALRDEITHLRGLIAFRDTEVGNLRELMAEERRRHDEAMAEERRIIAGLMARLPQIAGPETARRGATGQDTTVVSPATAGQPDATSAQPEQPRRPWWRRWR